MRKLIIFFGKLLFCCKSKKTHPNPKNILIIRSGSIGDVLMTTPLVRAIKNKYPKAKISYLTGNWSKDVLKNNKNINKIIAVDDSIFFKKKLTKISSLIKKIKRRKFDLCFILDKSYLFNLFAYFCKIPVRIGFNRKGEGFANNLNVCFKGKKHELDYYADIAKLINAPVKKEMDLFLSKKDEQFANSILKKIKNKNLVGIAAGGAENPGQKMYVKRWPKENYIELIKKLVDKNYFVILFGGGGDKELNDRIIKEVKSKNIINVAGKTSMHQSVALIKKIKMFITHDSGAMHLASIAKIPLIALFGPTQPERFAPKGAVIIKSKCKPCYDIYGNIKKCRKDCMKDIKVEDVLSRIR